MNYLKTTPIINASNYVTSGNLFVKLEQHNFLKSIKSVTASYLINDIVHRGGITNVVESSSGNLGIALGYFAKLANLEFLCLLDSSVPQSKIDRFASLNIVFEVVNSSQEADPRTARIRYAKQLAQQKGWFWTNQYDNPVNGRAHYEVTGPQMYKQMEEKIDIFICSLGSGGTMAGVSRFLKEMNSNIMVVGVEPAGSTIFGGEPKPYLTAGSGLSKPSKLIEGCYHLINYYYQVEDQNAIYECIRFQETEGVDVGISTGSVLYAARKLCAMYPDKNIVVISPDSGECYKTLIDAYQDNNNNIDNEIKVVNKRRFNLEVKL